MGEMLLSFRAAISSSVATARASARRWRTWAVAGNAATHRTHRNEHRSTRSIWKLARSSIIAVRLHVCHTETGLMTSSESFASRAARWLAFGSAVSILFGIAPSQILLALAMVALLLSGEKLSLPPIKLPLALFILGTLVAFALAPHPADGLPQIRKLYVF